MKKQEVERIKTKLRKKLAVKKGKTDFSELKKLENEPLNDKQIDGFFEKLSKNKDLVEMLDMELFFGDKHMSITSYLFNKQFSQKYLKALKYYILNESLERQTEFNDEIYKVISTLYQRIKKLEDSASKNNS